MGEGEKQRLEDSYSIRLQEEYEKQEDCWVMMESDSHNNHDSTSSTSHGSATSSLEFEDDASSSSPSNSSPHSNGPLYELSELMAQLPIKRGLSKFYEGKSQSFTSLSRVKSIEDLAKKETPHKKKLKACKSYAGGLDTHKSFTLPKPTITKKVSRGSSLSIPYMQSRRGSFSGCSSLPPLPVQKNFQCF